MIKMKLKRKALSALLCAAMLLTACSTTGTESAQTSSDVSQIQSSISDTSEMQVFEIDIQNSAMPEIIKAELSGKCNDRIENKVEMYESRNVLHEGVVGRLGIPLEVKCSGVKDAEIALYYDKGELRGVPEKNIIMLHCTAPNEPYNTVEKAQLDTAKGVVYAPYQGDGVYLLADAYKWYSAWGMDASEYAYKNDPTDHKTDWERNCDTGSIMKLADKEWAMKNAPTFHVSTPQQLASVVYYVNGVNPTYKTISVILDNDIDITGYDWKPMGWNTSSNHCFCGTVNGCGHVIKGMSIKQGYEQSGFIGYGWEAEMKDISFINAKVSGTHSTGIAAGEVYSSTTWTNVYTQGVVSGGSDDYGAIIGRETSTTFKNCSCDVTIDGKPFKYFSYRQKRTAETPVEETFQLKLNKDYTITRDEHAGFENLGWVILKNDEQILERNAENELTLPATDVQWHKGSSGEFTVYLQAWKKDGYVRVSNIIEYTH